MNTTLRTRLLLAISVTIIVTLSATQYGLYLLIRQQLYAEFDQNLGAKARALAVMIEQNGDAIDIEFAQHPMQEFARGVRPEYWQIWHEDGHVIARSRRLQTDFVPLNGSLVRPLVEEIILPDGRRGRAAGVRFRPQMDLEPEEQGERRKAASLGDDDEDDRDSIDLSNVAFVTLVIARDTQDVEASLARLTWLLIGSGLAACAVILGVLAWLVTRNLQPLQSLARQIGAVSEQSLSQQFSLTQAPGELQPVVTRLNDLMMRLDAAFQREKSFTGDVAHELRTPLAGIRSTLDVSLSRRRDEESYRASMERCLRISEETETIVGTLLSLSRMESGQTKPENDLMEFHRVLRRTWQPFATAAAERRATVDWATEVPPLIEADAGKLQVILSNLFDNATSYVDAGGRILIDSRFVAGQLTIRVSNTGCELTNEQVRRVFDRFWRADVARSETGRHSGLGLALTRRIVQLLEGTIDASCADGCFIAEVRLPVQNVEVPDDFDESIPAVPLEPAGAGPGIFN